MVKYLVSLWEKYDLKNFREKILETEPIEILIKFYQKSIKDVFD